MSVSHNPIPDELNALVEQVIGAAIDVHRELGPGFQEITYRRALEIELRKRGIRYEAEVPVVLQYKGEGVGQGRIDVLVERMLVLELKASEANPKKYSKQASVYLKATGYRLALIINFEVERLVDGIARIAN